MDVSGDELQQGLYDMADLFDYTVRRDIKDSYALFAIVLLTGKTWRHYLCLLTAIVGYCTETVRNRVRKLFFCVVGSYAPCSIPQGGGH